MLYDAALHTFIEESRELLTEMEHSLLQLAQGIPSEDGIHAIFRAAHTIKGSAGLFGLDAVVAFTHVAETLLDEVRAGAVPLTESLIRLLLQCCDHMHALTNAIEQGHDLADARLVAQGNQLCGALRGHSLALQSAGANGTAPSSQGCSARSDARTDGSATFPTCPTWPTWCITVRFGPSVMQNGMDPLSFVRYLHSLGEVLQFALLTDDVPTLDQLDAELCYLGFCMHWRGEADRAQLEAVFEFVRDDCQLDITLQSQTVATAAAPALAHSAPASAPSAVPADISTAAIFPAVVDVAPTVPPPALHPDTLLHGASSKPRSTEHQTVRVDAHKLDQLIDLVGELIIAAAGTTEVARQLRATDMLEANATLTSLVEQVRDQALQLRMVKIDGTFNKFQRVVHDVARELGKDIALVVSGEDTELDKTVVERIGDPLTHLVRNAMDHGIEPAAVRVARGKPAQGTLRLNAFHESGHIVIEISDDGGGLDRARILAKGIERGLVEAGKTLTDKEIDALIFEPGFSTATEITNLSGRGVGMDVVRSNITALRGSVEIQSDPGQGTTVQVRLPLTLAIINGFQVRVGHTVFVVPLEMVDECIEYTGDHTHHYTDLRGSVLPFVPLRTHFGLQGPRSARPNIVVIKHGNTRFGLLVDALMGEAQTVIKPLSRLFVHARGISGSSILGNGNVALILDIPVLHQQLLRVVGAESTPTVTAH